MGQTPPIPAPTLYLTQDPDPTIFPALSLPVPALALPPSLDPAQTDGPCALGDKGTAGGTSQGMATSAPGPAEAPMAAVKLESVLDPKELSTVSAERWRSRGRGGLRAGGHGSPMDLQRLNKVNLQSLQPQCANMTGGTAPSEKPHAR